MKLSKTISMAALAVLGCSSISTAETVVKGPIVRHMALNPGLNAQVQILPMMKNPHRRHYTIETLPDNATLYYEGEPITSEGFTLMDANKVTVDPDDGDVTVLFSYTSTDTDGRVSKPRSIIMRFKNLHIAGTVHHDPDGNARVDGEKISNLDEKPLYITLVNKEAKVLSSKALSPDGTFMFSNSDGIQPNTNYALIVSMEKNVSASVLPKAWAASGETANALEKGKDAQKDGIVVVNLKEKEIKDIAFGLEMRPLAVSKKKKRELNPGVDKQVVVPKLEGSDAEDGKKIRYFISTLPGNATVYNNGKKITKTGVEIKKLNRLTLNPDTGDQDVTLGYVTVDSAGISSYEASIFMSFDGLSISGQVFNDGNNNRLVDGQPLSELDGQQLYVTLLDERNIVQASVPLDSNASFHFDGTQGVAPEATYQVLLSTKKNGRNSELPEAWNFASEEVMGKKIKIANPKEGNLRVSIGHKDISPVNFGLNKKPAATALPVLTQLNPGDDIRIAVPTLQGTDRENSEGLTYSITSLPENAKLYYDETLIEKEGFVVTDPSKLTLDPVDGEVNISFAYKVTDKAGIDSEPVKVLMDFKELRLSGHLLDDGNSDATVSGEVLSHVDGKKLYVLLLNEKKELLASKPFKQGTFTFDGKAGVKPESTFFLALATAPETKAFGLPETWNSTGEAINSLTGMKDSHADAVIRVDVDKESVSQIDFGINKQPVAENKETKSQLNPGLDTQVTVPILSGHDKESGTNLSYVIESVPTLGTLYYQGTKIEKDGFEVEIPDGLTLDPYDSDVIVLFAYAVRDEAGVLSAPARVKMTFKGLRISGRIVNDGDGDEKVKGKPIRIPKKMKPYATLLDQNNSILASKLLTRDATFSFDGKNGVRPHADFSVVISLKKNATEPLLPSQWAESGAQSGDVKESQSDGKLNVHVFEENVDKVTFGVNKKPTAEAKKAKSQINPGGEARVDVPVLSGHDRESGTHLRYRIKSLPENAVLYNKNKPVSLDEYVDPKALTLNPNDGKQDVKFTYVTVDPENIQSDPAEVTMQFRGVSISGKVLEDFILDGLVESVTGIDNANITLFVTLLNDKDEVLTSVPVQKDGSYLIDESKGVNAHTSYRLVLSKEANATHSVLPDGWNHADGENINSLGKGNDGKADGMIDVMVKDGDLKQVDFSMNFLIQ